MRPHLLATIAVGAALCCSDAQALARAGAPVAGAPVAVAVDTGFVTNTTGRRGVISENVVRVPRASWVRVTFDTATLGAASPRGRPTVLRITSRADRAVQHLDAETLDQWGGSSAYFNGDAVTLELIADPGAAPSRLAVSSVVAGLDPGIPASICGPGDDRLQSGDPRVARALGLGCTAFIISDDANCLLTAGHCLLGGFNVVEFNVPPSDAEGNIQHPGPEDQYAVDLSSVQYAWGILGNDWSYFGCHPNTETGLTPIEAQAAFFELADTVPALDDQVIRITGYGIDDDPPQQNRTQQTALGPYLGYDGAADSVAYAADTQPSNSGSPVIVEQTGEVIGVHTNGGCDESGANGGTALSNPLLQSALAVPRGVCVPQASLSFVLPQGVPAVLHPDGDTVGVEVLGAYGGVPEPGSGLLHYDRGEGWTTVPMTEVSANVYDAVFPALVCGRRVEFFFSAASSGGEVVTEPRFAPLVTLESVGGTSMTATFADDFESDLGWTVQDSATLSDGRWQRGVPAASGERGDPTVDADGSGYCFLTGNANGNSDVDGGSTTLISPIMDASQDTMLIAYWRWFSNSRGSSPFEDPLVVEVSADAGQTWVLLETVGPGGVEVNGGWNRRQFLVSDFVAPTDAFRIRFVASDAAADSIIEAAVDGVQLLEVGCPAGPGDVDGDGLVGIVDFLALLDAWGPCPGPCPPACAADFDVDCAVGILDFLILLDNWTG